MGDFLIISYCIEHRCVSFFEPLFSAAAMQIFIDLSELPDGFYRKVFEITVNNIKSGYDNDLINFSSLLSDDELSRLSGILAIGRQSADPKKEFADCIKLVREENTKKNKKSAADMTDDEFRRMFNT